MTKVEAEEIKTRIEDINKRYAPIKLNFKMYPSLHPYDDDNWFVTIVYNYTENEWFALFSMNHSYAQVMEKLNGVEWGFEAVQAYQEEYGNLKFSQSDVPLG
jgi:hypothetical protein